MKVLISFPASILILAPLLMIGTMSVSFDAHAADEAAAAAPAAAAPKDTTGSGVKVTLDRKGFRAATEDGRFKFKMGGRVHVDGTYHVGDSPGDIPATPPTIPATFISL